MTTTDTPATTTLEVLITGSYGPLAIRLAEDLQSRGHHVRTLLAAEYTPSSAHVVPYQRANMSAPDDLAAAVQTADVILMMTGLGPIAAMVSDAESLNTVLARARPHTVLIHTSTPRRAARQRSLG